MTADNMLDEIQRLRTIVRDMWLDLQAANPDAPGSLAISDNEIAAEGATGLETVRAFLRSEDGRGIVVKSDNDELSVSTVEAGYGE